MDTTLLVAETVPIERRQEHFNRLANVLVNLKSKPPSMTIRQVATNLMAFDCTTEEFELFENLFHTK